MLAILRTRRKCLSETEPTDAALHIRIVSHSYNTSNQTASLTFTSAPNRGYLIEHDSDLQGPSRRGHSRVLTHF